MKTNTGRISVLCAMVLVCAMGLCQAEDIAIAPYLGWGIVELGSPPLPRPVPLVISVATDKAAYVPGELLIASVTAYNPNDYERKLNFNSSLQALAIIDGHTPFCVATQFFTSVSIPALSSHTWRSGHDWSDYDLAIGIHSVVGTVLNTGYSEPYSFDVIAPTLPSSDVLIDFEHLPDGRALPKMGQFDDEYAAWGVHFGMTRSRGMTDIAVHGKGGNQHAAAVGGCSYPTGFNIIAEFDMPVYGVSAEVTSAAGMTVTMVAKDSNGEIIGSVVSDTVPAVKEFVGGVDFRSDTPIASVEWWPSQANAAVMVDNVYLTIPEPATLSLLAFGGLSLIRRKRN